MAICAQEMVSPRLKTKTEETWRYLWDKTRSCFIDCEWSRTLCDKAPAPRVIAHGCGLIFFHKTIQTTMSQSSFWFQFTYERTAPFCVSITTQFKALALLFLLWEVHKYWLSCQIIRIINVNPVVDLALILFSSVWHSWKVTPCHTMQTWSYLSTAGSGSLCSVHISSLMPFPPAVRLELTNSAGIIGD